MDQDFDALQQARLSQFFVANIRGSNRERANLDLQFLQATCESKKKHRRKRFPAYTSSLRLDLTKAKITQKYRQRRYSEIAKRKQFIKFVQQLKKKVHFSIHLLFLVLLF